MASTAIQSDVPKASYITSNETVQIHCLSIITALFAYISSKYDPVTCRLFLRGSNAIPLIKGMLNDKQTFPYNFSSDFDIEVAINPVLPTRYFDNLHKNILDDILDFFISTANNPSLWKTFHTEAPRYGISIAKLNTNLPIYAGNVYTKRNENLLKTTTKYISKDSPFYVYKVNDIAPPPLTPIGVSQVKFGIRVPNYESKGHPYKSFDLIDVSIPKKTYEYLPKLWDITNYDVYIYNKQIEGYPMFLFPVINLPASIQNMEYAANEAREPRSKKRNTRKNAANSLRKFMKFVKTMPPSHIRNRTIKRAQNLGVVPE